MVTKKKTEDTVTNLDALLEYDAPTDGGAPSAPAVDDDPDQEQETESHENAVKTVEQLEMEALRAELERVKAEAAEAARAKAVARPVPESELSPEQREIRALKDELARAKGKAIDNVEPLVERGDGVVTIHILQDGFTAQDRVWVRGQEIVFGPVALEQTLDRYGRSWLDMTDEEQFERWEAILFRKGPWPGKRTYEEASLAGVSITTKAPVLRD